MIYSNERTKFSLHLINDYRRKHSLSALVSQYQLINATYDHCVWMAKNDKLSHYSGGWFGFFGESQSDRLAKAGLNNVACGENIAFGQETVEEVVECWQNSSGHNRNLLGPYVHGSLVGIKNKNGRLYWCLGLCSNV